MSNQGPSRSNSGDDDAESWRSRAIELTPGGSGESKPRVQEKVPTKKVSPPASSQSSEISTPNQETSRSQSGSDGAESWRSRAIELTPGGSREPKPQVQEIVPTSEVSAPASNHSSQVPAGWEPLDPATSYQDHGDQEEVSRRRRKRMSWVEWSGIGVIVALLVATYLMMSVRKDAPERTADVRDQRDAGADVSASVDAPLATTTPRRVVSTETAVSKDETVEKIVGNVLGAAGDGSFSLGNEPDSGNENSQNAQPLSNENTQSVAKSSPEPVSEPAIRKARPKRKPVFPPAPPLDELIPIRTGDESTDRASAEPQQPLKAPITLPIMEPATVSFDRVYAKAFETHQEYIEQKKADPDSEATIELLRDSIQLFRQCLARPAGEYSPSAREQIQYTLATLYRDAGQLFASAVFAINVAQFGDTAAPTTVASVGVAFAALHESHLSHFGDAANPGELNQVVRLLTLAERRSIPVKQFDSMWYSTAQLFERDGHHIEAARCYAKVGDRSELFAKAQLAAGRQLWAEVLHREQQSIEAQRSEIESAAAKYLAGGISAMQSDNQVSSTLLAAKISSAKISLRREDPDRAIELLDGADGVLKQLKAQSGIPKSFAITANEELLRAYRMAGDFDGVRATITRLSTLYGKSGKDRIAGLYRGIAKELLDELDQVRPLTDPQIDQVEKVLEALLGSEAKSSSDLSLWAADVWAGLADQSDDKQVRNRCLRNADRLLGSVADSNQLSEGQRLGLQLNRIELARQSGDLDNAIASVSKILAKTPTAIDLQITAAELLLEKAIQSSSPDDFEASVVGRSADSIWGWAKLSSTLVRMHYDSEDKDQYFDRMMKCSVRLDEARLLQAEAMPSGDRRRETASSARSHLRQLKSTFASSSPEWTERITQVEERFAGLP